MIGRLQRQKDQDRVIRTLNFAIDGLNFNKEVMRVTLVKDVFGTVAVVLDMIRVRSLPFRGEIF